MRKDVHRMILTNKQRQSKARWTVCGAVLLVVALAAATNTVNAQNAFPNGGMYNQGSPGQGYPGQGFPAQGNMGQGNPGPGSQNGAATDPGLIRDWFSKYDLVRRQAQMTPAERNKADDLMSHGLQMFVPGEEKVIAKSLLTNLVGKYDRACEQLKQLRLYPETSALHHQYFEYFKEAKELFSDYLRVQNNLMVKDNNGNSVMAGLMERKAKLEATEQRAKAMDNDVRNRFGIPPYRY
jgi:hypothetical protein